MSVVKDDYGIFPQWETDRAGRRTARAAPLLSLAPPAQERFYVIAQLLDREGPQQQKE
jgi:hypothetical protein